jgi:uncharacterized delta-60 repeat protein
VTAEDPGFTRTYTVAVIRRYGGMLDSNFATGVGAAYQIYTIALQGDGKILIGGFLVSYNGVSSGGIARLNSDGSLDTSFAAVGAGADADVCSIALQDDGKILIGGYFHNYNGIGRGSVARLNSDGSLDTSFLATGEGAEYPVYSVAVQSNGKILIGGQFATYNGTSRGRIARLNSDGSLDTSFLATGVGADQTVYAIALQGDGKILIAGYFTAYNGVSRGYVARLNGDGSLDTSFLSTDVGADRGPILSIAEQGDGKVLIGGGFYYFNGIRRNMVARLNSDGTLDATFLATGNGADGDVRSVVLQNDGEILIGGGFIDYNGIGRRGIARLNSDGSLDTSFLVTGTGTNGWLYSVAVLSDGKILIGGQFTTYNGTARGNFARIWGD